MGLPSQVVIHTRVVEKACVESYRGGGKSPRHQYSGDSISLRSRYHPSRDHFHSRPIRPMAVAVQVPGSSEVGYGVGDRQASGLASQGLLLGIQIMGPILFQLGHFSRMRSVVHVLSLASWDTLLEVIIVP